MPRRPPLGPGPLSASGVLSSTYASIYVRAGRSGQTLRSPTFGCDHLKGGRALPPGHYLPPAGGRGPLSASDVLPSTYASIYVRSAPLRGGRRAASLLGPVDPARIYRFLPSTTVAAAVPAPLRECGPARIPRSLSSTTVVAVISAPRARGAAAS